MQGDELINARSTTKNAKTGTTTPKGQKTIGSLQPREGRSTKAPTTRTQSGDKVKYIRKQKPQYIRKLSNCSNIHNSN